MKLRLLQELRWVARNLLLTVFPCRCTVCQNRLETFEKHICTSCYSLLPFTRLHGEQGNIVERLFWERIPIERANSFIRYLPDTNSSRIIKSLKYYNKPGIGIFFGRAMANDLRDTDFFNDINLIIPVPLHPNKLRHRGYNQSTQLALGVSQITGIPVREDIIERIKDTDTQTKKSHTERRENMEGAFKKINDDAVKGQHILIIDDVITTNATLLSCAKELVRKSPNTRISILTLGLAGFHPLITKAPIILPNP